MGSYKGYLGNAAKVMTDAAEIVQRIQQPGCSIKHLMAEYRCAYNTIKRVILSQISKRQWRAIAKKKMGTGKAENRFQKGHKAWNKGRTGVSFPGSEKGQFKKGHLPAAHRHVGSTRIITRTRKGNTIWHKEIKVSGIMQGRHKWIPYAQYLWEQKHGPVPKGFFVVHKDGITLNDTDENFKLVDRKGHLELQMHRDPNMLKRCRKNGAKAAKRRHAKNRKLKAKQLREAQREKALEIKINPVMESGLTELSGPETSWFECIGCGEEYKTHPKGLCKKCGGFRFEKIKQRLQKVAV